MALCNNGHDLERYGAVSRGFRANGKPYVSRYCKECKRISTAASKKRQRMERARLEQTEPVSLDRSSIEAIRAQRIVNLIDRKERAATKWERDEIQREINELRDQGQGANREEVNP